MYNDCNWPRNPYGNTSWANPSISNDYWGFEYLEAHKTSNIGTQVSLWTTWTDTPLYLGRGEIYHAKRTDLCRRDYLCYIVEYVELTDKGYSELIPYSYGVCTDEPLIDIYVNGSLLSPKYGYMRNFTLGTVQFEMIKIPRSYLDENSSILWRGELERYMSIWEAQHVARTN